MGRWRRGLSRLREAVWRARNGGRAGRGRTGDEPPAGAGAAPAGTADGAAADHETAELTAAYWRAYDQRMATVRFSDVARRFPALIGQAVRLGWSASKPDTLATITLNLVSGVFGGYALFATTGVLEALFAGGPTPHRVRAALPSLILVAAATATRSAVSTAAGWAQSRLEPQVDQVVEVQLYDLTSQVALAAFDDSDFHDRMQRARDRGVYSASALVNDVINFITAFAGLASAAVVVGVLQPILLAVLLLAQLPGAWSAVRSARIRYLTRFALIDSYRRKYILASLIAERQTAAELRSFTMRAFLIGRVSRLSAYARARRAAGRPAADGDQGDRQRPRRPRHRRGLRGARRAARHRHAGPVGRGHRGPRAAVGRRVAAAADVQRQPDLRGRPVLLRLRGVLRGRAVPDPGRRARPRRRPGSSGSSRPASPSPTRARTSRRCATCRSRSAGAR